MIIIIKKNLDFIISRSTCKKLAKHRLRTSGLTFTAISLAIHVIGHFRKSILIYKISPLHFVIIVLINFTIQWHKQ